MEMWGDNIVTFTINGTVYHASASNATAEMSLNTFIRENAKLHGTKYMCKEGGCGSCVVTMQSTHPVTKQDLIYSVNSCLVPVLACHGVAITTVEGIGNKIKGYHQVQKNLAQFNGTQCGYCSPGFVMNMYSLMKGKDDLTMKEIENSFGGNICRCTGYRPILDSFKALAKDASDELKLKTIDIEDLMTQKCKIGKCSNACRSCSLKTCTEDDTEISDFIELSLASKTLKMSFSSNKIWYKVNSVSEIFQIFDLIGGNSYMLLAGNTSQGVFPVPIEEKPNVYIDINDIAELKSYTILNDRLILGANMTLTETMTLFSAVSKENPLLFGYLQILADHIDLVANVPVRNIGTLAGNLMIKHTHKEFQSDIFLMFELCCAFLTIREISGLERQVPLLQFLNMDLNQMVITSIILPGWSSRDYIIKTYKIMPRKQNVHALVNAGFIFRVNTNSYTIEEPPRIVYGAISPQFVHAYQTEAYLSGKPIYNVDILKGALKILSSEINPEPHPPEASPKYRKRLALGLFYKFVLSINPTMVKEMYRSGAHLLERPLSSGKQDFDTSPSSEWPVHKPVQKLEAMVQASGEAFYVDDIAITESELHASLVIAKTGRATLKSIDPSAALTIPGVVAFYSAKDIPGRNSFISASALTPEEEEIFGSDKITYYGQPVAVIVAVTQEIAEEAVKYVKINYSDVKKPLLTIKEVLKSGDITRRIPKNKMIPKKLPGPIEYKIKGEMEMEGQYHYTMELQSCLCIPKEDSLKIYSATQWMDNVQVTVAQMLNIPQNSVEVEVKRLGGAYGSKITRSSLVANACALASHKLNKPVRMVLDLRTQMAAVGKRFPFHATYDAGVDKDGKIQYLIMEANHDYGVSLNEDISLFFGDLIKNVYDSSTWKLDAYAIKTDHVSSAWTRAPGSLEGLTLIEHIMEHISQVTGKDPISVRMANVEESEKEVLEEMVETIKSSSEYEKRVKLVEKINEENRWKKRGISFVPMKFEIVFFPGYSCFVSILGGDGTVIVSHSGIEMGQGINTKVAQVVAYELGVDLDKVSVKPSMTLISPNGFASGGSITSDAICYGALKCCQELKTRLIPVTKTLKKIDWLEIIKNAVKIGLNLTSTYMFSATDSLENKYPVYGATVLETELDVITGQYQILRVDLLEDTGTSLSPNVDIGQIEGAFVMGLGYFSSEELHFDENGKNLTDRTWTYWPPGAKDIPIDFRVTLRKKSKNPKGVMGSKSTGEPPLCMSSALMFALRQAVRSARKDAGMKDDWFTYNQPCTVEKTLLTCGTDEEKFNI